MPIQRLAMAPIQRKIRQPHVPIQRLATAVSQRKRREHSKVCYSIEPEKKISATRAHYCSKKRAYYVHSEGIGMHFLNPSLLQRMPISRT